MPATFDHTIIASLDGSVSAQLFSELLEAEPAPSWGPFTNIGLDGGVMLQFAAPPVEIQMQRYALLVDDAHLDRGGVYVKDPAGHGVGADHPLVLLSDVAQS